MKTGIELIAEERERQVAVEGWHPSHDDAHKKGELAGAAACYALHAAGFLNPHCVEAIRDPLLDTKFPLWPWAQSWWKPSTEIRDLVKAGALIAAELDRRQRLEAAKAPKVI